MVARLANGLVVPLTRPNRQDNTQCAVTERLVLGNSLHQSILRATTQIEEQYQIIVVEV